MWPRAAPHVYPHGPIWGRVDRVGDLNTRKRDGTTWPVMQAETQGQDQARTPTDRLREMNEILLAYLFVFKQSVSLYGYPHIMA